VNDHPLTTTPLTMPRMLGADWCGDCRRSKALLERLGVAYEYVDLEAEPERYAEVEAISGGRSIPTILFPEGDHLVEPDDATLEARVEVDAVDAISELGELGGTGMPGEPGALGAEEARIRDELAAETNEDDFLCYVDPQQG
jgi:glutaredoxin